MSNPPSDQRPKPAPSLPPRESAGARLGAEDRANLVAYLDNELEPEQSRALAVLLTQSVTARREVDSLRRSWELLGFLPKPEVSSDFTSQTLTSVSLLATRGDRRYRQAARGLGRLASAAALLLTIAAGVGGGFWLASRVWPDPNARLIRDLPLAEHFEEYRALGSPSLVEELDHLAIDFEPESP